MSSLSGKFLVAALRLAWSECATSNPATSLRAKLLEKSGLAFTVVAAGAIKSTSANGQTTEFAGLGEGITQTDLVECWSRLIEVFDASSAALGNGATDAQIEIDMEARLRDVRGYVTDWRFLQK